MPCLVFPLQFVRDEAIGFLTTNNERKPPSIAEKFPALLAVKDPVATKAQALLAGSGLHVQASGVHARPAGDFYAIGELLRALRSSEKAITVIWPVLVEVCTGRVISGRLLRSLMALEKRLGGHASLVDPRWRERLTAVGAAAIERAVRDMAAAEGKHTERGAAMAISALLNKGLTKNKLLVDLS